MSPPPSRTVGAGSRGPSAAGRQWGDRGAASLLVLAIGLTLVAAGLAGAAVGAARVARHQARAAADFGALAGAVHAAQGEQAACVRAAELVGANGGRLTHCRLDGLELVIRAEVAVTPLPALDRAASASARAGPVGAAG